MKNLSALNRETLISIILDLDEVLANQDETTIWELQTLTSQRNKAWNDLESMNNTRQYWKDIALDYKRQLIEAGLIETRYRKKPLVQNETIEEPIETKKFKITIIKNGERKDIDDLPKKEYKPKETYKHEVSSPAGNITGTKHSGHKTKDEVLIGIFPDGTIIEFDSVNEAKDYIRKNYDKYKESPLTNISRAARRSGFYVNNDGTAYDIQWSYKYKDDEYTVDGVQIERGE